MKQQKAIGILLLIGAVGVLVPYTLLTMIFEYPDILRQDTGVILTKFYEGGSGLVWTWFAFALTGLPLIPAYLMMGKQLEDRSSLAGIATKIGLIGLIVQMIGLLRWTFVVPVLADAYVHGDAASKAAAIMSFKTIHQFAGVLLGEHLGQLFTIVWTVLMSIVLMRERLIPRWAGWFGIVSAVIYFFAQAELLATVIPGVPVWEMAGFIGSTLWLIWLVIISINWRRSSIKVPK